MDEHKTIAQVSELICQLIADQTKTERNELTAMRYELVGKVARLERELADSKMLYKAQAESHDQAMRDLNAANEEITKLNYELADVLKGIADANERESQPIDSAGHAVVDMPAPCEDAYRQHSDI